MNCDIRIVFSSRTHLEERWKFFNAKMLSAVLVGAVPFGNNYFFPKRNIMAILK